MLNVEKFQKQIVLSIEVDKIIHEWTENGEGDFVGWYNNIDTGKPVYYIPVDRNMNKAIKEKVLNYLKDIMNYGEGTKYDIINNTLMYNVLEDEDCNPINSENTDLFLCDYTVSVLLNGIELEEKELQEIF